MWLSWTRLFLYMRLRTLNDRSIADDDDNNENTQYATSANGWQSSAPIIFETLPILFCISLSKWFAILVFLKYDSIEISFLCSCSSCSTRKKSFTTRDKAWKAHPYEYVLIRLSAIARLQHSNRVFTFTLDESVTKPWSDVELNWKSWHHFWTISYNSWFKLNASFLHLPILKKMKI